MARIIVFWTKARPMMAVHAGGAQPYFVKISVWPTAEADRLGIIGDSRDDFSPLRRSYPFVAHMVRRGEAQCLVDAKTS